MDYDEMIERLALRTGVSLAETEMMMKRVVTFRTDCQVAVHVYLEKESDVVPVPKFEPEIQCAKDWASLKGKRRV